MTILDKLMPLALCAALGTLPAAADYPDRPVRLVLPFPAGGPSDNAARTVAQAMAQSLGQPVVIENRPGAEGAIAAGSVKAAPADGYTLFWATSAVLALPIVSRPAPFETLADFSPVASIGRFAYAMYVHPGIPSRTMGEFIAYARAHPGKLNYASVNLAEQLAASQFMRAAKVEMVRVPYKGASHLLPDLVAGRVHVNFGPVGGGLPHVKQGKLRMLATLSAERTAVTPDVPTMTEAGMPGVSVGTYQVILAPAGTSPEIVARLSREVNLALQKPDVRERLEQLALIVEGGTPQELALMIREAEGAWAEFIREAGLAPR